MHRRSWLAGLALVAAFNLAWVAAPAGAQAAKITIFAAASLKDALDAIAGKWKAETGNETAISYAASSTLAKQIENGAPADLFISADLDWMDYVQQRSLIDTASRSDLLGNKLVLIAPADSKQGEVKIAPGFSLAKLLGDGKLAMGEPSSVPAGKYGKAALTKLGAWGDVAAHVAAAESVRAALLLVARGEAPFGIVYQTDAAVEKGVKIVGVFPDDTHPPIIYPVALTKSGTAITAAAAFAQYLRSSTAAAIFSTNGFTVLDKGK
ncbi:MAG: molybdate ABC transporter substrate-binding protein [Alphaproteobacteria bacterium]|nr:molybdate ABC transporter substrate-binding protein [Alphaproteobacteria bacterium]